MKKVVEIQGELYEVLFDGFASLSHFGDLDIEIEEVICLRTGCAVPDTIVTNNDAIMEDLEKYFQDNYEPPGD